MIRKSLVFVLAGFVLFVGADAQTPAPGAKGETRAFSMFFDGDGAYLGVQTEEITKDNFSKYGLREVRGVAVEKVMEGSPAEKSGLQSGDVIVRFNNEEVTSTRKLTRLMGEVAPDHQVRLTVIRGGSEREIVATAGKRPVPKFNEGGFTWNGPSFPQGENFPRMERLPRMENFPNMQNERMVFGFGSGRRIGITVTVLTKQLGEHFGVTSGVMVSEVRADSPAAKAGVKAGDIIVEIDGKEVKADGDLIRAIAEKKEGDVALTIVRDRNRQTVRVTPEEVKDGFDGRLLEFPQTSDGTFAPGQMRFSMPSINFPAGGFRFPSSIWCLL
jgi:membrane-associated protease RseP (regulator of RpoE activity)